MIIYRAHCPENRKYSIRESIFELHHIGKIPLYVQVWNPDPKNKMTEEDAHLNVSGRDYYDDLTGAVIEYDFYVTYELIQKQRFSYCCRG